MNYAEEQKNEIEALESIYYGDFQIISVNPYKFSIPIKSDDYDPDNNIGLCCDLVITYAPKYPEEAPIIEIENSENFEDEYESILLKYLEEQASDNLGMVMVFTLVSSAQEWLHDKYETAKHEKEAKEAQRIKELEEAEQKKNTRLPTAWYNEKGGKKLVLPRDIRWNALSGCLEIYVKEYPNLILICEEHKEEIDPVVFKKISDIYIKRMAEDFFVPKGVERFIFLNRYVSKFEGTRVTIETFLKWRQQFEEEMGIDKKRELADKEGRKLTGRELFMTDNTLNESDLKFLDEGDRVKVDESLFQDLDDLDLEDEDDEDFDPDNFNSDSS